MTVGRCPRAALPQSFADRTHARGERREATGVSHQVSPALLFPSVGAPQKASPSFGEVPYLIPSQAAALPRKLTRSSPSAPQPSSFPFKTFGTRSTSPSPGKPNQTQPSSNIVVCISSRTFGSHSVFVNSSSPSFPHRIRHRRQDAIQVQGRAPLREAQGGGRAYPPEVRRPYPGMNHPFLSSSPRCRLRWSL